MSTIDSLVIDNVVAGFYDDFVTYPLVLYALLKRFIQEGDVQNMHAILNSLHIAAVHAGLSYRMDGGFPPLLQVALTNRNKPAFYFLMHYGPIDSMEEGISNKETFSEWRGRTELMNFYKTLVAFYQLIHELKKTRKLDRDKLADICKEIQTMLHAPSLTEDSRQIMYGEFDVCVTELWRIAKCWCVEKFESDDLVQVYHALKMIMDIEDAEIPLYHFMRWHI